MEGRDQILCDPLDHFMVTVYYRPWRRFFRKTMIIRCFSCDLKIVDP